MTTTIEVLLWLVAVFSFLGALVNSVSPTTALGPGAVPAAWVCFTVALVGLAVLNPR